MLSEGTIGKNILPIIQQNLRILPKYSLIQLRDLGYLPMFAQLSEEESQNLEPEHVLSRKLTSRMELPKKLICFSLLYTSCNVLVPYRYILLTISSIQKHFDSSGSLKVTQYRLA